MQSENNLYFNVAHWVKIELLKQQSIDGKPNYKVVKRHGTKHVTQTFPFYEWAKGYFTELIADYL